MLYNKNIHYEDNDYEESGYNEGYYSSSHTTPVEVEKYIKGIQFPANKEDIIRQAEKNNAPENVMEIINRFEDKDYNSPVDIAKEVSNVE